MACSPSVLDCFVSSCYIGGYSDLVKCSCAVLIEIEVKRLWLASRETSTCCNNYENALEHSFQMKQTIKAAWMKVKYK